MSSPGTPGKGWLGSRRRVICGYCSLESRYDNLRRHISNVHGKDLPIKYKVIKVKDSIKHFLINKPGDDEDNNNKGHDEGNNNKGKVLDGNKH